MPRSAMSTIVSQLAWCDHLVGAHVQGFFTMHYYIYDIYRLINALFPSAGRLVFCAFAAFFFGGSGLFVAVASAPAAFPVARSAARDAILVLLAVDSPAPTAAVL